MVTPGYSTAGAMVHGAEPSCDLEWHWMTECIKKILNRALFPSSAKYSAQTECHSEPAQSCWLWVQFTYVDISLTGFVGIASHSQLAFHGFLCHNHLFWATTYLAESSPALSHDPLCLARMQSRHERPLSAAALPGPIALQNIAGVRKRFQKRAAVTSRIRLFAAWTSTFSMD